MLIGSHFNFFFPYFLIPAPAGCRRRQSHLARLCTLQKPGFWGQRKKSKFETGICSWDGKDGAGSFASNTPRAARERSSSQGPSISPGCRPKSSREAQQRQTLQGASPKPSLCFIAPPGALPLPSFGSRGMLQPCPCTRHAAGEAPCSMPNGPGIASESFSGVFCFAVGITSHQHS